jgi:hypothetical protein
MPSSVRRDNLGDRSVRSLGGGERSIVLKFTGAAIDLDRIESHPCCRRFVAKSVEQCVFRRPIVRKKTRSSAQSHPGEGRLSGRPFCGSGE